MPQPDFLQRAFERKDPRLSQLAVRILNIYLTSPLSKRQDTSDDRKAQIKRLIEEAVRGSRMR